MGENFRKKVNYIYNIIYEDVIYLYNKLKEKSKYEMILIFLLLPIVWVFVLIFLVVYICYFLYFFLYFFIKYLIKYKYKKEVEPLKYNLIKTKLNNNICVFFVIMLNDVPKQYAYNNLYNYLYLIKNVKNKKNNKNLLEFKNIFIEILLILFFKIIIRWVILIIFSYSFLVIKTSLNIVESIIKIKRLKLKNTKIFLQYVLFDFAEKYNRIYNKVNEKKIIFSEKEVVFNPMKHLKKGGEEILNKAKDKIIVEINLTREKLNDVLQAIENIKEKTSITYSIFEDQDTLEKELKPHTTAVIPLNDEKSITFRGTTKKLVKVVGFDEKGDKISKEMETHTPYKGSIDPFKIEYKTDVIEIKSNNIKYLENERLLKNLQENPKIKDVIFNGLINSLENSTYVWEYGKLFEDPKYKNFIEKIEKDPNLKNDHKLKESLELIKNVYKDNLEIIKQEKGDRVFDSVIRILILNKDHQWDLDYVGYIISLL